MNQEPGTTHHAQYLSLFILIFSCYVFFLHPNPGDNVNSRLDLTAAIANENTTRIDRYHTNTIDKAKINGHYYSDKAPGTSIWALPVAVIFRLRGTVSPESVWFRYVATIFVVALPAALAAVLVLVFLTHLTGNGIFSLAIALFYSLGTLAFPYSTMFYSHVLTASLALTAFYPLFSARLKKDEPTPRIIALAGTLCGAMVITEYPSVITAGILFIYAFLTVRKKWNCIFFILGMLPFAAIVLIYNQISFGNMFTSGYLHEAMPDFNAGMAQGIAGFTLPEIKTFYGMLFSPGRGLFWESPFLVFSIPGWLFIFRRREYRLEAMIALAIVLEVLLISASAFMPEGGMAMGPRYLIPALPFLCIPIAFVPVRKTAVKGLFLGLGIASIALMFIATMTDPQVLRGFDHPYQQFILEIFHAGYVRANLLKLFAGNYSVLILAVWISILSLALFQQKIKRILIEKQYREFIKICTLTIATAVIFIILFQLTNMATMRKEEGWRYCRLGTYYRHAKMNKDALSAYRQGTRMEGEIWECYFGLGIMQFTDGKINFAEKSFREVIRIKPNLSEAHFNLGHIYYQTGRFEQALQEYQKCADLTTGIDDDAVAKAYFFMALTNKKLGKEKEADKNYIHAIKTSPYTIDQILQRFR